MQSPAVKTPATNKRAGSAATNKSSGKKLVQARLPFKIIATATAAAAAGSVVEPKETNDETTKDGRKRKLSFDGEPNGTETKNGTEQSRERSASKENITVNAKKKKIVADDVDDIILLDDDDIAEEEDEANKSAEEDKKVVEEKTVGKVAQKDEKQTPKNKNKLKAGSKPKVTTPKQKASTDKNPSETPKTRDVKEKKPATPKTATVKGEKIGTPKTMNSPQTPQNKEVKGKQENTPKSKAANKQKTDTPNSTKAGKASTPGSAKTKSNSDTNKASGSAAKVQIKLPLGSAKVNKRRKSKISLDAAAAEVIVSSDDNETNPVKKPKLDTSANKRKNGGAKDKVNTLNGDISSPTSLDDSSTTESEENSNVLVLEIGGNEDTDVVPDSELDSRCSSITVISKDAASKQASPTKEEIPDDKSKDKDSPNQSDKPEKDIESEPVKSEQKASQIAIASEAKSKEIIETKVVVNKAKEENSEKNKLPEKAEGAETKEKKDIEQNSADISVVIESSSDSDSSARHNESNTNAEQSSTNIATPKNLKEDTNKSLKKTLTPKQIKLMEQRRKAREEKERKLQEEKLQKQREKEAKELERKREREEREEQRRKEREEKEEQKRKEREERDEVKRKEREEKERKRLAELEVKNEEKRKRNEAKEEELRKKEDERKRKEEADLKAKKVAEAFQKFFKTKRTSNGDEGDATAQTNDDAKSLAFRPFEVKGDMKMAPICRKPMSNERRAQLDDCFKGEALMDKQDLYLAELKCGKIIPGMWRRISVDTKVSEDDVQIIGCDDDLDRAGQAIVEETHAPVERFRTKFYKFHENRRPPYYGTWRKRTNVIRARRPFVQDTKFFDYEVDSDLEWEEEEPGESLDGSDDEKEKESEDEDYEVDNEWFVPHGHLSDEELQNEDDDANNREAQKAKLQVLQQEFAQEMKKKTEKIKPRLIGCIWTDENGNQPALCPKIIWDTLNNRAMLCAAPPLLEDPEVPEKLETGSPTSNEKTAEKAKPIKITEAMLNDLVRLVHGNHHSKNFLIKEFIAFLEASEESIKNGAARGPIKSLVREKIDEFAEWTITESTKVSQSNKKKNKKHLCWVVAADVLKRMGLECLDLHNNWKYTLEPKLKPESTKPNAEVTAADADEKEITAKVENKNETKSTPKAKKKIFSENSQPKVAKVKTNAEITKFTKVLSTNTATEKTLKTSETPTPNDETKPAASTIKTAPTTAAPDPAKPKKRVALLMSVPRGQQISQPTKNVLISEFLKKGNADKGEAGNKITSKAKESSDTKAAAISEVVVLD